MTRPRVLRRAATALLAFGAALWMAAPVAAECMYIPPFPRAEEAIRSARQVIVGDLVTASAADLGIPSDQGRRTMALQVTEVLRGSQEVGDLVDVEYLEPNWPWWKYRGGNGQAFPSCAYLLMEADIGDTIALALGAVQPRQRLHADGISWIQPRTTYNAMSKIGDAEKLAEIRSLADLPATDKAPLMAAAPAEPADHTWVLVAAITALAGAVLWLRTGRREVGDRADRR